MPVGAPGWCTGLHDHIAHPRTPPPTGGTAGAEATAGAGGGGRMQPCACARLGQLEGPRWAPGPVAPLHRGGARGRGAAAGGCGCAPAGARGPRAHLGSARAGGAERAPRVGGWAGSGRGEGTGGGAPGVCVCHRGVCVCVTGGCPGGARPRALPARAAPGRVLPPVGRAAAPPRPREAPPL